MNMDINEINFNNLTREEAIVKIHQIGKKNLLPLAVWISESIGCKNAYEAIRIAIANAEREADGIRDLHREFIERKQE